MKVYTTNSGKPLAHFLSRMHEEGKLFDLWHVVAGPQNDHTIFDSELEARSHFNFLFDENASRGKAVWATSSDVPIYALEFF